MKNKSKNIFLLIVCVVPILFSIGFILIPKVNNANTGVVLYYIITGIILIQLIFIWMYVRFKESNTLYSLSLNNFIQLSKGNIVLEQAPGSSSDTKKFNSLQNNVSQYYNELQDVALNISKGNLDVNYQPKSTDDVLGGTMVNLKEKLKKINEEENARSWSSNGLAEFVSLLREESDSKQLCNSVLSFIIKYIKANQGSIYLLEKNESEEEILTTAAMYAYGRQKHFVQQIYPGEGLVGQCFYEKQIIYLTDVPHNYIKITSGLGEALPRCVILIPLLYNDELVGVLEIASFQVWNEYEINFLKRVSEYLASTISGLKVTQQTKILLEKADQLNQDLNNQSEEMRQNMEELRSTQEEIERQNMEFTGLYLAVNQTMATADLSKNGLIIKVNENFAGLLESSSQSFEGNHLQEYINCNATGISFHEILNKVSKGETFNGTFLINSTKNTKWLSGTFSPLLDESQNVARILFLASDISKEKKLQLDTMSQAEELNKKMIEIEAERKKNLAILEGCVDGVLSFNSKGVVNFFNKAAEEIWETDRLNVIGKQINDLMPVEISIKNDNTSVFYTNGHGKKELSVRTEVTFSNSKGSSTDALVTLTSATLGNDYNFTCFVQKISVDLF